MLEKFNQRVQKTIICATFNALGTKGQFNDSFN